MSGASSYPPDVQALLDGIEARRAKLRASKDASPVKPVKPDPRWKMILRSAIENGGVVTTVGMVDHNYSVAMATLRKNLSRADVAFKYTAGTRGRGSKPGLLRIIDMESARALLA